MARAKRSQLEIWRAALYREYLWHYAASRTPIYLVTEYPKSGGSWLCQMLAEYLELPYPRNVKPKNEKSVVHGHKMFHKSYRNAIVMLRDGRDVMVSAYYHYLFKNERNSHGLVDKFRAKLQFEDYHDIERNMPRFIEHMFTARIHRFNDFTWAHFIDSWIGQTDRIVKYEDLLDDPVGVMSVALNKLTGEEIDVVRLKDTVDRFSFSNVTNRRKGEEDVNAFVRKGVSGEWKERFNQEARATFEYHAGDQLIKAGYEEDNDWV